MDRYKEIIPQFQKFKDVIKTSPPYDIRVNGIKSSIQEVKKFLKREGLEFEQREWNEKFIKVKSNPSKTLAHWLGKFYIQEYSSGIPPLALNPCPEDDVLDMCAAPGSKTTQISDMMNNEGQIIANDIRPARTKGLLSNLYRLGCVNTQVTERDARKLPGKPKFDKVLLDAPCSGEGNVRSQENLGGGASEARIEELSNLQERLLEKAFEVCKVNGIIVYSTCTFAPEENEFIVAKFLDKGKLMDPNFDFEHARGILEWDGESLNEELEKCVRVYPHNLDSGGMFVAKFKKKG